MAPRRPAALSPIGRIPVTGYLSGDELVPGGSATIHASGPPAPATLRVTRAGAPVPGDAGRGWTEAPVSWAPARTVTLSERTLACGSHLEVDPAPRLTGALTFAAWCRPTRLPAGWSTIAWQGDGDRVDWGLFCGGPGILTAVAAYDGGQAWCAAKDPLCVDVWQLVAVTCDPDRGVLAVTLWNPARDAEPRRDEVALGPGDRPDSGGAPPAGTAEGTDAAAVAAAVAASNAAEDAAAAAATAAGAPPARLLIGARHDADGAVADGFDGRIARPLLLARTVAPDELEDVVARAGEGDAALRAAWRLERDVDRARVADASGGGHDADVRNAPLRAVTGPGWSGRGGRRYTDGPADYDAIHLHEDDLEDAGWDVTSELAIGADARPGIHLARLATTDDELCLPFVVTSPRPTEPLAFLAPTLSWQAYSSNRPTHEHTEDGALDAIGALYDLHLDGTARHLVSRLRPTRAGAPERGIRPWGAHTVASDLMLCAGLEALGLPHDVLADRQLHAAGAALLAPYRCVVLGAHPEYTTTAMRDALDAYLAGGGRLIYLGGNGFYWVTSIDPERPHVIEVRKGGIGEAGAEFKHGPGENQHQTTLEDGGFWTERGRPARALVGVEFVANGHVPGAGVRGFERLAAAADPRYAWVFEGVDEPDPLGAYGLNLGSAVGYEMDAVQPWTWSADQPEPVVLARASDPTLYGPRLIPVTPGADIALRVLPGGGATFAAGSVTWSGSIAHDGCDNPIAQITANVVRRFRDTPAGTPVA